MEPWVNYAPSKPIITGPTNGRIWLRYKYTLKSTDPNGDNLHYNINWGDGHLEHTDNYPSGVEVTVSHRWCSEGTKTIKVFATDEFGSSGSLAVLEVSMPRNHENIVSNWLRLIDMFPILQKILSFVI